MRIVDLNVLLYAVNSDAPQHDVVRAWWESAVDDEDGVGLAWVVMLGFLRIATHPRVFPRPLPLSTASGKLDAWLALDNVRVVHERGDHWAHLRSLIGASGTAGNLTTDAHLAALSMSHDATLVSCDADFARFAGLRWFNPLSIR